MLLGEEADDKPPPSQITVAPFDENSPKFILFNWWHISKAAAVSKKTKNTIAAAFAFSAIGGRLLRPFDRHFKFHFGLLGVQLGASEF